MCIRDRREGGRGRVCACLEALTPGVEVHRRQLCDRWRLHKQVQRLHHAIHEIHVINHAHIHVIAQPIQVRARTLQVKNAILSYTPRQHSHSTGFRS
eukprot:706635-Rhodomonas_salina.3